MKLLGVAAVGCGAAIGAWLCWWLGLRLNSLLPPLPLGRLAADLVGGLLIGIAITLFDRHAALPPEARLLVVTGFLGGLTTFSTFSAELSALLLRADLPWAIGLLGAHVGGSVLLTIVGIFTVRLLPGG